MPNRGITYILIATFSFAIMNILAKALSGLHVSQIIFFRALGTFLFILPYMLYNGVSIVGRHPKLLSLRAILGLISLATFFMAIQLIPLGSAISIRYLGPIFGAFLAFIYLKEQVSAWQWVSFAIAFSGVIAIKGFDLRVSTIGLLLSLISAFFLGFIFVLIRYLATREHYLTIINYFMVVSILVSLLFISQWRWPIGDEWYAVVCIGVFGLIGQVFMTRAFVEEETSVLAPFKYMEIIYAIILGLIFFGEGYSLPAFAGIALIIVGMIMNVIAKERMKKSRVSVRS